MGGGWAGFGAAWGLSKAGWDVTVIDAAPSPGGVAGNRGTNIELGVKGCWSHYRNIERLLDTELGLPVSTVYNDYSETAFYSSRGLEVVAPVFRDCKPRLPAPLGTLAHTYNRFTGLPFLDRLTAFPLTQGEWAWFLSLFS